MKKIIFLNPFDAAMVGFEEKMRLPKSALKDFEDLFFTAYIYAEKNCELDQMPLEYVQMVRNHQLMGNIPLTVAENAVVAKVHGTLVREDDLDSAGEFENVVFLNPEVFDEPIMVSKRIAEIMADQDALDKIGCHYVKIQQIFASDDVLFVPICHFEYLEVIAGKPIFVEVTQDVASKILDAQGNLKRFDLFVVECGNKRKICQWNDRCQLLIEEDSEGEPRLYPSLITPVGKKTRTVLRLVTQ